LHGQGIEATVARVECSNCEKESTETDEQQRCFPEGKEASALYAIFLANMQLRNCAKVSFFAN